MKFTLHFDQTQRKTQFLLRKIVLTKIWPFLKLSPFQRRGFYGAILFLDFRALFFFFFPSPYYLGRSVVVFVCVWLCLFVCVSCILWNFFVEVFILLRAIGFEGSPFCSGFSTKKKLWMITIVMVLSILSFQKKELLKFN